MGNELFFHGASQAIVIVSSWEGSKQTCYQLLLKMHVKCGKQQRTKCMGGTGYFTTVSNPGTYVPQVKGFQKLSCFWGAFKEGDLSLYDAICRACPLVFVNRKKENVLVLCMFQTVTVLPVANAFGRIQMQDASKHKEINR